MFKYIQISNFFYIKSLVGIPLRSASVPGKYLSRPFYTFSSPFVRFNNKEKAKPHRRNNEQTAKNTTPGSDGSICLVPINYGHSSNNRPSAIWKQSNILTSV